MSGDHDDPGELLTISLTHDPCEGSRGSVVTVAGRVTTIHEAIELFEDLLRGAGFHCPHASIQFDAGDDK